MRVECSRTVCVCVRAYACVCVCVLDFRQVLANLKPISEYG